MGNLAAEHERNIEGGVMRRVLIKDFDTLQKDCGGFTTFGNLMPPKGYEKSFVPRMRPLCGCEVTVSANGWVQGLADFQNMRFESWMYEEKCTGTPSERLRRNTEYQARKKVEPLLGPCLSCGEIKLLDMEGAMGECRDCLHASRKDFESNVMEVLENIKEILLQKNRKYGDSALNPSRIFAKSGAVEQINVRIDDKLKRIQNRQGDEDEDVETDLLGYLVLLKIAKRKGGEA